MMEFTKADLNNIQALITFGFQKGAVTSQDHAKVLLFLEEKVKTALMSEVEDGDNVPASD